ncbi:MAG: GvpL/GvpF family gas vesicle protein [Elusimicrobia bacterium]|nr:GvpL/GvpF family gas vesicle protein [Elusimicrobiota bacterium]
MRKTGKYLYGIIASAAAKFPGAEAAPDLAGIYTIPHRDAAAVVSDCEIIDYKSMRKDAVAMLLVRHQKAIENIMELGNTIIPIRLGTFACDDAEVRDILVKGYRLIKEIIPKVHDKIEIDVAVTWKDFGSILKGIGQEKEITELKKVLLGAAKGVTVDDQMKVGLKVMEILDEKKQHYSSLIQDTLKRMSHDCKAHELMDDQMVMNSAFLISKAKQEEFYARIESLNKECSEKLNFRCIGPLPPYSFYTIDIKKLDFKDLEWARNQLGVSTMIITKSEIKRHYHRAAHALHPDKNPDKPGMEKEFGNAARAYKILADYCRAGEQTRQTDGGPAGSEADISFSEEKFKESAILVKMTD